MGKPRERILEATIALLRNSHDIASLTVRAIAEKAAVGVGLVNYHFGDKNGLVREAVRAFIGREVIKGYGDRRVEGSSMAEKVEGLLRGPMDFLAEYPLLSRISVLFDLSSPGAEDNSEASFRELSTALRSIL